MVITIIVCKFKIQSIAYDAYKNETLTASAVYDGTPDNDKWSKATPSGELRLVISNEDAQGIFEPGENVSITINRFIPEIPSV